MTTYMTKGESRIAHLTRLPSPLTLCSLHFVGAWDCHHNVLLLDGQRLCKRCATKELKVSK